jgi:hypothetical protein
MKKLLILSALFILGCSGGDSSTDSNDLNCDLDNANLKFSQINANMNYSQVANIMGVDGNNFRTDNLGSGNVLKFYSWEYCEGGDNRIECWFQNDDFLQLKVKYFPNNSCTNNVNQSNYSSISVGDSYASISSLLDDQGDNFRSDYYLTNIIYANYYRWYNCSNRSDYIEIWFDVNGEAFLINKSF